MGSNLGDRRYYIDAAVKRIKALNITRVKKMSGIIQTLPEGGPPQGPYLNAVLEIDTELSPYQLLEELQKIESSLGRVRGVIDAPRTIDLDILTYGELRINEHALCIPHPRILERKFVLIPFKSIAPEVVKKLQSKPKSLARKYITGRKSISKRKKLTSHDKTTRMVKLKRK